MNNTWTKEAIYEYHKLATRDCKASKVSSGIARLAKKYIKGKILDIGAGRADLMAVLKRKGFNDVTSIDLVGKSEFGVIEMDISSLKFPNNSFDAVFCMDVIEHLSDKDLEGAISEMARVLKIRGRAIVTTLYKENLEDSLFFCPQCRKFSHAYGHQQVFDKDRIRSLLNKFNLKTKRMETLHLGGYTLFPLFFQLLKKTRCYMLLPGEIRKMFDRDLFVVAEKE